MALHLERPVTAAGLLLAAWIWPSEEPAVPAGRKAALLAQCRDALERRMGVELDPHVAELPNVTARKGGGFRLAASVSVNGLEQAFSCEVTSPESGSTVAAIHLISF